MPNSLIHETSPYLLQHAHNPVNWYPWGEEALHLAKSQNKIILVSIGYAACHWCHVMERESFENEDVAKLMNDNFINIKVDREERPDIDNIYMEAVQAMTGSGGWPLNVFLTPDAKPFYGGTYFPPAKAYNRTSWTDVLQSIKQAWTTRSHEIAAQSENLTEHLQKSNFTISLQKEENNSAFTTENCFVIAQNILKKADTEWGGFGAAPKFPQTFTIQYLLQHYHFSKNEQALNQALLSINKMLDGGIYDHLGGGLSRYSVDKEWLAPHFEKMLYDNALLINILADAYQITKQKKYEKAIHHIIHFLQTEMMDAAGGFYAAIDADSEGEEGKFYTWQKQEIETILKEDAELFCAYFDVTEKGNWEHKNILRILKPIETFATEKQLQINEFETFLQACKHKLLHQRNNRIRPITDDKIILAWNALLITALCKASSALNCKPYIRLAIDTFEFITQKFIVQKDAYEFYHTFKNDRAKYPAFLDDYAFLIQAAIYLQEATADTKYLHFAQQLTAYTIHQFTDEATGYFFFTNKNQTDAIIRKTEMYDGATPSGNAIMAQNLFYLSLVFNNTEWNNRAKKMIDNLQTAITKYPTSFSNWASSLLNQTIGINELAIVGKNYETVREELLQNFIPNKVLQSSSAADNRFLLLKDKKPNNEAFIYRCIEYSCDKPVTNVADLVKLINKTDKII